MNARNLIQVELTEDEIKEAIVEYLSKKEFVCNSEDVCFMNKGVQNFYSCQARCVQAGGPYFQSGTLKLSDLKV